MTRLPSTSSILLKSVRSYTVPRFAIAVTYFASWLVVKRFVPCPIAERTASSSLIRGSDSGISRPEVSPRPNISAYFASLSVPTSEE